MREGEGAGAWLQRWRRRVRVLVRKAEVAREMDDEMRFHLEMEAADIAHSEGVSADEARRRAQLAFGGTDRFKEEAWRARGVRPVDDLMADVRHGIRWLRKTPGFAVVAVLTLALGIGVTTSTFSVVSVLLLRPLPYADADRIVMVGEVPKTEPAKVSNTSYPNFADWREQSTSFEAMALFNDWQPSFTGGGEPERLTGALVTAELFDILRVRPYLGRAMSAADNQPGSDPVIVVSHAFWQRRLQSDPAIVGRTIDLNGRARTVIAILPPDFHAPGELDADVWGNNYFDASDTRGSRYLRAIARLAPGVTMDQVNEEMAAISARLEAAYPADNRGLIARVIPLRDTLTGEVRGPVLALFGAAFFVLLIVCANLANLLLARGTARARELSIRAALGADRFRTVRQLLTESAILVAIGGGAGVLLAYGVTELIQQRAPSVIRSQDIAVDGGVLGFTCLLALLVTLLVGALPAWRGAQLDPQSAMKDGARGSTESGRRMRTRGVLVAAQMGLALTLLVGTGLLIRSLAHLSRIDPGVRSDHVLAMSMNLTAASYPGGSEPAFFRELITRVNAVPGVRAVAVTSILPFGGSWDRIALDLDGAPVEEGMDKPEADRYIVSPDYFATMGIQLVAGRLLDASDTYDRPLVAVVDEVFARRIAPDGNAIGRRTRLPGRDSLATVVGIVSHVKHYGLDKISTGQIYMSHDQYPWRWMNLVVHTTVAPRTLARPVRDVVWSLNRDQAVFGITTMDQLMAERAEVRRFVVVLLGVFAAIALLVAAVGLYGVIAYGVAQRRLEIGIRIALGAQRAQVIRLVIGDAIVLAVAGAALGLLGAAAGARLLQGLLYNVGTTDPAVLAAVTMFLLLVALLASYVPARRAAHVSPLQSLRAG